MNQKKPYEKDFVVWTEEQASALKTRQFTRLDYDNLIEEIEDMGKSEKRSLESYLQRLIEHLLKLQYWESEYEYNHRHWKAEINNFRNQIKKIIKRSPSLKNYLIEVYSEIYQDSLESKRFEFDIPDHQPISLERVLDKKYFGETQN